MKTLLKITLLEPLTNSKIDELLNGSELIGLLVERAYPCGDVPDVLSLALPSQVTEGFVEALKTVIAESSWIHEQDAFVFVAKYDEGVIDLTGSYVRSDVDTGLSRPMEPGKSFRVSFVVPSFDSGQKVVSGTLNYGSSFPAGMIDDLLEIGIEIDSDSTAEEITILSACVSGFRIAFEKPSGETGNYIFDYDFANKILKL